MAIVSMDLGYLFVLAPRTASTAIGESVLLPQLDGRWIPEEDVLDKRGRTVAQRKHSTLNDLLRQHLIDEETSRDLLVFTTVRNPFDSLASLYTKQRFRYQQLVDDRDSFVHREVGYRTMMRLAARSRFDTWLQVFVRLDRLRQQRSASRAERGHLYWRYLEGADVVMRFESLQRDFDAVLARLGVEDRPQIPHVNPTREKSDDWRSLYTKRSRGLVERTYGRDLERFGYAFST